MTKGMIKDGDKVTLEVDAKKRALSARNHSATHLLHKALRTVLGTHVEQAGSSVNEDRLRFDFTHFSAMTPEELQKVEDIVNEQISKGLDVIVKNMPIEEAKKTGAQALFGEKYGDIVRVVNMSDFSIEFCGGTHVKNTSEIMAFKIISESGVAAGVRRIEALTSDGLMKYYAQIEETLKNAAHLLKTTPDNLADKITHMMAENKSLHGEVESLKSKVAQEAAGNVMDQVKEIKGVKLLSAQLDGIDMNGLRDLGDQFKAKLGEGVVVLASANDGKVSLMVTATDGAMKQGAHAGKPDQRHRRMCRRRRRRTPEHGAGRRKEPGRHPGCARKSGRKCWNLRSNRGKYRFLAEKQLTHEKNMIYIFVSAIKIPEQSYYAQYQAGGEVRCETMSNVIVKENETLDSALRRFKRSCAKAGIQQEIRKREHYEKPSVRRKKKSEAARKRKYN